MKYVVYPDVLWVTNFALDLLVLTLVRRLKKSRSPFWRLLLAAAFGATASLFLFLRLRHYILYQLLTHTLANPLMILLGFPVKGLRGFWKNFFATYLMTVLLGGILNFGVATLGQWNQFWLWAVGGFGICMLALSWLDSRKLERQCFEILLLTPGRRVPLTGFLDTGNLLQDPFQNQPVHIIQEKVLAEELSGELLAVRYIPYHSLGQENGLLPVVTLPAMYLRPAGEQDIPPQYLEKPVFGLAKEKLFQKKGYQVILNARDL